MDFAAGGDAPTQPMPMSLSVPRITRGASVEANGVIVHSEIFKESLLLPMGDARDVKSDFREPII